MENLDINTLFVMGVLSFIPVIMFGYIIILYSLFVQKTIWEVLNAYIIKNTSVGNYLLIAFIFFGFMQDKQLSGIFALGIASFFYATGLVLSYGKLTCTVVNISDSEKQGGVF